MHQQELHRSKLKSGIKRREESLQELAEDLELLVRLAYALAPEEMKDLLAKEQFTDAILDGEDGRRSLKQSWPQSLWAALTLAMELESYRLASSQEKFPVRGMYCGVYCPIPHRLKQCLSPYSKFNAQGFAENSCQPF